MSDMIDLLKIRRSVPPLLLSEPAPSAGEIETMLTIAARVPDHGKLVPWRFILYQGAARDVASKIVSTAFLHRNPAADDASKAKESTRFSAAPLVIGVISTAVPHVKIPEWEQQLSAGAVCQTLVIAATAMGYGASWLTGWFAYDAEVLGKLGVKPGERVAGFVHIGTARERVPDRPRPLLADIVTTFE